MKSQFEKNKEILLEDIERYSEQPITNSIADRLSAYMGAYKALCMLENGEEYTHSVVAQHEEKPAKKTARTTELDGDTEFETILMGIPIDADHVTAVFNVFADHMESLSVMNRRAYENVMMRLREVARE